LNANESKQNALEYAIFDASAHGSLAHTCNWIILQGLRGQQSHTLTFSCRNSMLRKQTVQGWNDIAVPIRPPREYSDEGMQTKTCNLSLAKGLRH
jgi:hypothetical protein